jgi:hypothetical protein
LSVLSFIFDFIELLPTSINAHMATRFFYLCYCFIEKFCLLMHYRNFVCWCTRITEDLLLQTIEKNKCVKVLAYLKFLKHMVVEAFLLQLRMGQTTRRAPQQCTWLAVPSRGCSQADKKCESQFCRIQFEPSLLVLDCEI